MSSCNAASAGIGHAADAALLQHAPTSGAGSFATRIPEWVYTKGRRRKPSVEERSKWDKYRPDILIIAETNKRSIKRRETDVVEMTYCRDTDPTRCNRAGAENHHDAAALQLPQQIPTAV
jgi:hypothetical protein